MSTATRPSITVLPLTPSVAAHEYYVPSDRLISGNPLQTVWLEYQDASAQFCAGIWSSDVGEWRIRYTEEEYCHILEGRSVITDEGGHAFTAVAGSEFTIPAGFTGTWRVEAPTRKRFVIYEHEGGPQA